MAKAKELDQLTLDAIAAEKARMSYGKYMAMKEPAVIQPKNDPAVRYGVCLYCGERFIMDKHRVRAYCDYECYNRHYGQRKREQMKEEQANEQAENVRDE